MTTMAKKELVNKVMKAKGAKTTVKAPAKPAAKKAENTKAPAKKAPAKKPVAKKKPVFEGFPESFNVEGLGKLYIAPEKAFTTYEAIKEAYESGVELFFAVHWAPANMKKYGGKDLSIAVKSFPDNMDVLCPVYCKERVKELILVSQYTESFFHLVEDGEENFEVKEVEVNGEVFAGRLNLDLFFEIYTLEPVELEEEEDEEDVVDESDEDSEDYEEEEEDTEEEEEDLEEEDLEEEEEEVPPAKKAPVKKAPVKKAPAKKVAPVKKAPAKRVAKK